FDGSPGRTRQGRYLGVERGGAAPKREERDAEVVQLRQPCVGRELRVEDEVARALAVALLPKRNEAQHLVCFLALAEIRVRIAEDLALRVLCEEGQDGLSALTATRHVVFLDER